MITGMDSARIIAEARASAALSIRALAGAAQVSPSTVHRIEQGRLVPTVEMLDRLVRAAGGRLEVAVRPDPRTITGLAQTIEADLRQDPEDCTVPVRRAAEFAAHFDRSEPSTEQSMIRPRPPRTGDAHWDAFLAALVEWLAVGHGVDVPEWVHDPSRYLKEGWWVTTMPSMHAWEFAGSPASFQSHGVYLHRDSLANV
jgi:transcriptional regulator with XRE-family HTH domain